MNLMYSPLMLTASSTLILSTLMALSSSNWILLWAAMELNLLSFIPIIMQTKNNQETEGSIKYFLAQAFGSAIILMTSSAMWMPFSALPNSLSTMLTCAVLLKLGSVPCHFWYPSVMLSISWTSCLILSTWQKLAPLAILAFLLPQKFTCFLTAMASLNALVGGIMGMNQSQMRSIMAYSSIGHIGWMISLLVVLKPNASMMYFVIYSLMITPLFIMLMYFNMDTSKQMNKLSSLNPIIQVSIIITLMSLGGLPPLTGFMPKMMTVMLLMGSMKLLVLMLIMGSVMNLFFYLNICINLMFTQVGNNNKKLTLSAHPNTMIIAAGTMSLGMSPLIMMYAMTLLYKS